MLVLIPKCSYFKYNYEYALQFRCHVTVRNSVVILVQPSLTDISKCIEFKLQEETDSLFIPMKELLWKQHGKMANLLKITPLWVLNMVHIIFAHPLYLLL